MMGQDEILSALEFALGLEKTSVIVRPEFTHRFRKGEPAVKTQGELRAK